MLLNVQKNTTAEDPLWGEDVMDGLEVREILKKAGFREDLTVTYEDTDEGEGWEVDLTWEEFAAKTTYVHPDAVAIELEGGFAIWAATH